MGSLGPKNDFFSRGETAPMVSNWGGVPCLTYRVLYFWTLDNFLDLPSHLVPFISSYKQILIWWNPALRLTSDLHEGRGKVYISVFTTKPDPKSPFSRCLLTEHQHVKVKLRAKWFTGSYHFLAVRTSSGYTTTYILFSYQQAERTHGRCQ